MEFRTVFNRTPEKLEVMWDSKVYTLPPNSKTFLPAQIAEAAKKQNPIMGTEDPNTGAMLYLVGIEEEGDDLSPLEKIPVAAERWDRARANGWRPIELVPQSSPAIPPSVRVPDGVSFVKP